MSRGFPNTFTRLFHRHVGGTGLWFLIFGLAFATWAFISGTITGHLPRWSSPYLIGPLVLGTGAGLGIILRRRWAQNRVLGLYVLVAILVSFSAPVYANASAAVGGLLVVIAALAVVDRISTTSDLSSAADCISPLRHLDRRHGVGLALVIVVGLFLSSDSQAALVLLIPLVATSAWALFMMPIPPRWMVVSGGIFIAQMSAVAVIELGFRTSWPSWLAAGDSLSSARHILWSDALSLWQQNPIIGAGPGTFTESSELASSIPHLAAVHSSVLQVGAELGSVGLLLLGTLFVSGLFFATRGEKTQGLIAGMSWSMLAVHSVIDHLEDFPIVALTAGVVLGWAASSRNRNTHRTSKKG